MYHRLSEDPESFLESGERQHWHRSNLDNLLEKVYNYYVGKGFYCILLSRLLSLISLLWIVSLVTFMVSCIDYDLLFEHYDLQRALQFQGLPHFYALCLIIFCLFWLWKAFSFIKETHANLEIRQFFEQELKISGEEIKTIEWEDVSSRILQVPRLCLGKEQFTHLDVMNRIMRRDNFMIILINKDILRLRLPIPFLRGEFMTKTLEWSLYYIIFGLVLDGDRINPNVADKAKSASLANDLRNRFRFFGLLGLLLSPFVFIFLVIYFIFRYGEQLRSHPTNLAARQWSPLACWKIRHLSELPHELQRRLHKSYEPAEQYVRSFPYPALAECARFISLITGSLVVVILVLSFWNDGALKIEIIGDYSTVWFLGVGGSIIAVCRAFIPDDSVVFEPKTHMDEVVKNTAYRPEAWKGKEHTYEVLNAFTQLFQYKLQILVIELLSVLFTPFILMFSLPSCAENIVEFFRNQSVHERGVGDICRFARFSLKENGNPLFFPSSRAPLQDQTSDGKMEASLVAFSIKYEDWAAPKEEADFVSSVRSSASASSHPASPSRSVSSSWNGRSPISTREQSLEESSTNLFSLSPPLNKYHDPMM